MNPRFSGDDLDDRCVVVGEINEQIDAGGVCQLVPVLQRLPVAGRGGPSQWSARLDFQPDRPLGYGCIAVQAVGGGGVGEGVGVEGVLGGGAVGGSGVGDADGAG